MQYFLALKEGQKRVAAAREYLGSKCGGSAMPALALRDNKTNVWNPVGEEMLYAAVSESAGFVLTDTSGYIMAIVDSQGTSKAIVQGVSQGQKEAMVRAFEADGVPEYRGKVTLPV